MDEYISRNALLQIYKDIEINTIIRDLSWHEAWKILGDKIRSIPSYNMGEIVECRKCIYFDDCETKEDRDGCYFGDNEEEI